MGRLEVVETVGHFTAGAVEHLHRAGGPAGQHHHVLVRPGVERVLQMGRPHAAHFADVAAAGVHHPVGKGVGDMKLVADHRQPGGDSQTGTHQIANPAVGQIHFLDAVIGHVGDIKQAGFLIDGEVVQRRLEPGHPDFFAAIRLQAQQFSGGAVDHV